MNLDYDVILSEYCRVFLLNQQKKEEPQAPKEEPSKQKKLSDSITFD